MNIVLIGYRGTGKSAVGKILAGRLGLEYRGMDALIVERIGMGIPAFVAAKGWPSFRDVESEIASELATRDGLVVDTGGGVIERPINMEKLNASGLSFWLKASVATIVERIKDSVDRPPLVAGKTFTEEVAEVLERRTPLYRAAARYEIDTDPLTPEQVGERILALLPSL